MRRLGAMSLGLALSILPPASADDLPALSRDFWTWRAAHAPLNRDDVQRIERPPLWTPDWSPGSMAARRRDLEAFEARLKALEPGGRAVSEQVDRRLLASAFSRIRWELDVLRSWRRDPGFYVDQTLAALVDVLLPPAPFDLARSEEVLRRLDSIPRVLEDARGNLDEAVEPLARLALGDLKDIGPRLRSAATALAPHLAPGPAARILAGADHAARALESYRGWLEERVSGMPRGVAVGREAYLFFLRRVALIPWSPEEILAMGRRERERAVALEVYEAQRSLGIPEAPIFPDQTTQVDRARADEAAIRRFLVDRRILTVPSWIPRYGYRPLPPYLAALSGFGEETDFGSAGRRSAPTTRYIPVPSASLGYFALSMARDPRADMVHEGIPGHAFQLALSWSHEDEIRRHWYDSAVNEGLGFYCEEMMLRMGLFDDAPRTRQVLANFMRLRALRVEVDVRLALGTFSLDEAAEYLRTSTPMDAATARAEAASFASSPGFAMGYQIGKLQIQRLLADARRLQGDAFDLLSVHDSIWRNGNVPLALQRLELLGLSDDLEALDPPQGGSTGLRDRGAY